MKDQVNHVLVLLFFYAISNGSTLNGNFLHITQDLSLHVDLQNIQVFKDQQLSQKQIKNKQFLESSRRTDKKFSNNNFNIIDILILYL